VSLWFKSSWLLPNSTVLLNPSWNYTHWHTGSYIDMQSLPPAGYTAWWRCCKDGRDVNPALWGDNCPDCYHAKCEECEVIGGGPRPRPSRPPHGFKTMSFPISVDSHYFCEPECDCDCDCDPCSCSPPPPPRPRPTRSIGSKP
jgi:hypothetical protein